ncbi:putative development/cell death domain, kelch-type beta propeller [Helianthus annuus]|nr:ring canal kelch homolog [Helianthus annuus]KAJ0437751.1 putative DCD domain-containing protein NRP [Helianthus annuus]KAJ0442292.1 putative development/cell death domain, kelch-type beta propeller [Helianthus annuus]KAJ0460072.1 putative DCD domain-containing protein NRP [Helianthus annuus]KAJ0640517.1 putative DCD domain-containing protein NRP [Helianthus annuus]KAJ0644452.1 putative DCD domain-containing protein NRP [Helianthus annuus]
MNGSSRTTRGLWKDQFGGVIFGCKKTTINECLYKNLFGLPSSHFAYVKKIKPGLPVFLFNYTDRTLLGIFEAVSSGQMNIDPCAWTSEGYKTPFPAQVQIRVKLQCKALTENQFKPLIIDNYYALNHFWFELDHAQTNRLFSLLASQALSCPRTTLTPNNTTNKPTLSPSVEVISSHLKSDESSPINIKQVDSEKDVICMRIKELALKHKLAAPSPPSDENNVSPNLVDQAPLSSVVLNDKNNTMEKKSPKSDPMIAKLIEKIEELMTSKAARDTINHLQQKITFLEQDLAKAHAEIKNLKDMRNTSVLETCVGPLENNDIKLNDISLPDDPILLVGGFDGGSSLASLDCYSPSQNLTKSLSPMITERCYAAATKLDGELYVFGGGTCGHCFDTVESYDPVDDRWTTCPPLNRKRMSLAGVTVNDKIYAIGGGNGLDCYSTVEMLDFDVGAWIPSRSMLEKRFALAAAELNGALYAVGGSNGNCYLRTTERFDPREGCWKKTEGMSTIRGCPSMVVMNEKLYVLGGYDGKTMVSTVEIYDPRRGSWVFGEPMNHPRGFSAAAVAKDSIYVIGGLKGGDEINDTVECYKEGRGWEMTDTDEAYRRCFFSAIAL